MRIYVKNVRRDGKLTVALSYDNGVHLQKVMTVQQFEEQNAKADNPLPLPLTSRAIAMQQG